MGQSKSQYKPPPQPQLHTYNNAKKLHPNITEYSDLIDWTLGFINDNTDNKMSDQYKGQPFTKFMGFNICVNYVSLAQ